MIQEEKRIMKVCTWTANRKEKLIFIDVLHLHFDLHCIPYVERQKEFNQ